MRRKEKTIKAYRRKLQKKGEKIQKQDLSGLNSFHQATFVSMEKYWLFANGKYPTSLLSTLENDFKLTSTFLTQTPEDVVSTMDRLESIIKASSSKSLMDDLDKGTSRLSDIQTLVPKGMVNKGDALLYRTALLITEPPKTKGFSALSEPVQIKLIKGDWGNDTLNATLTIFQGLTGIALFSIVRNVIQESFDVTSDDIVKIHDLGNKYLDNAEESIRIGINSLNKINTLTAEIGGHLSDIEATSDDAAKISRYIANMTNLVSKPHNQMTDRQIKIAKGINYLLIRSIGRGR